jgi:hypothetical protein
MRRSTAPGLALAGTIALAGCEKPTPLVTISHGSSSTNAGALCYARSGQLSEAEITACTAKQGKKVSTRAGDRIGIGVDPSIAEQNWAAFLNSQPLLEVPSDRTFVSVVVPAGLQKDATADLIIVERGDKSSASAIRGIWKFRLQGV